MWRGALVGVLVVSMAACGADGGEPPVVALTPSAAQPAAAEGSGSGSGSGASRPDPAVPPEGVAAASDPDGANRSTVGSDLCGLADPHVLADVSRWADHVPALQAVLPPEVDVAAFVADLTPDTAAVPSVTTTIDLIWDAVDQQCSTDPLLPQCRAMVTLALADPVGWAVRAEDPAEVEVAFTLAIANWTDLRRLSPDEALRPAIDAHLRFLQPASERLAEVGWGPGRVDSLEPLEAELIALGEPEVVEPLAALEETCGLA